MNDVEYCPECNKVLSEAFRPLGLACECECEECGTMNEVKKSSLAAGDFTGQTTWVWWVLHREDAERYERWEQCVMWDGSQWHQHGPECAVYATPQPNGRIHPEDFQEGYEHATAEEKAALDVSEYEGLLLISEQPGKRSTKELSNVEN